FNNGEPSWRCDRVHVPEVTACGSGTDEAAAPTWEVRNVSARITETKRCQRRTTSRPANQRDGKDPPFTSALALMSVTSKEPPSSYGEAVLFIWLLKLRRCSDLTQALTSCQSPSLLLPVKNWEEMIWEGSIQDDGRSKKPRATRPTCDAFRQRTRHHPGFSPLKAPVGAPDRWASNGNGRPDNGKNRDPTLQHIPLSRALNILFRRLLLTSPLLSPIVLKGGPTFSTFYLPPLEMAPFSSAG
ncbi:hypothetical protein D4764_18G0009960, partial [Takifugu flavidus]